MLTDKLPSPSFTVVFAYSNESVMFFCSLYELWTGYSYYLCKILTVRAEGVC